MEFKEAHELISKLANGVDPKTGENLPVDHLLQRPEIVRAMMLSASALAGMANRDERKRRAPGNSGKAWTPEEDKKLELEFDRGTAFHTLAEVHKRSVFAVKARLVKLGKIEDDGSLNFREV